MSLHASGLWMAQLSLGTVDGRRRRLSSYHDTRDAAEEWIGDTLAVLRRDGRLPVRTPLGDWLAAWLQLEADRVSPKQLREDTDLVAGMPDWLLAQPLGRLESGHVQTWLDGMRRAKHAEGEAPKRLNPRTVAIRRNRLRAALNEAKRRQLVDHNAAADAKPPRQRRPKRVVVTAADARAILAAVKGWRYEAAVAVAIGTGIRQGELLGLTWADVEADRVVVRQRLRRIAGDRNAGKAGEYVIVDGTKPGDEEVRTVPLPAFAKTALDAWKKTQDKERREAGDNVDPLDRSVPVFTTEKGRHVNGTVLTHGLADCLEAAKLKHVTWYDLRHATTDILASRGVAQTVARDYVGHASVVTTADHYTGSDWDSLASAGAEIESAVGS